MRLEAAVLMPAPDRRVRKPENGQLLADAGELVTLTPYWRRRLADKDVLEGELPAEHPTPIPAPIAGKPRAAKTTTITKTGTN